MNTTAPMAMDEAVKALGQAFRELDEAAQALPTPYDERARDIATKVATTLKPLLQLCNEVRQDPSIRQVTEVRGPDDLDRFLVERGRSPFDAQSRPENMPYDN